MPCQMTTGRDLLLALAAMLGISRTLDADAVAPRHSTNSHTRGAIGPVSRLLLTTRDLVYCREPLGNLRRDPKDCLILLLMQLLVHNVCECNAWYNVKNPRITAMLLQRQACVTGTPVQELDCSITMESRVLSFKHLAS